jgi:aminopeptidase YwaD
MHKMQLKFFAVFFSLFVALFFCTIQPLSAQHQPLLADETITCIINQVSGNIALEHIRQLADFHRLQPSPEYHRAAQYVANWAKKYGLQNVNIESFPADGIKMNYTFTTRPAWEASEGELWLIKPTEKKLVSYDEIPLCLATYSREANVEAELIDIGSGIYPNDYQGKEIEGKIVLASGHPSAVMARAVFQRKALGIISYYTIDFQATRRPADYEQQITWGSIPYKKDGERKPTFAFMVSYRMAIDLKEMLSHGMQIVVKAKVNARIFPSNYEIVTAEIPGRVKPEEEILFIAHLDHYKPGANDNASGSSALLEIARSLLELVKERKIEPPQRTIKFMWVPETNGTMAYLAAHPKAFEKTIAVINMDMVGEDLKKCKSSLHLYRPPDSLPHYLGDVVQNFFEYVKVTNREDSIGDQTNLIISANGTRDGFDCSVEPYMGGSDHYIFNEGSIKIPSVAFICWPDVFYHSSEDTPDKCDPTTLKRVAFIGLSSALYLTNMDDNSANRLALECYSRAKERLAHDLKKSCDIIALSQKNNLAKNYKEAKIILKYSYQREFKMLESIACIAPKNNVLNELTRQLQQALLEDEKKNQQNIYYYYASLCQQYELEPEEITFAIAENHSLVPYRVNAYRGPIDGDFLDKHIGGEGLGSLKLFKSGQNKIMNLYNIMYELLNFVDGKRNIMQIRNAASAEFQPLPLDAIEEYFRALEKAGIVTLKNVKLDKAH